eukprot:3275593-Ditylum_brightwellii.AAC.1
MLRLAHREVLPPVIKYVKKVPPCAACRFATAQRRAWRTKAKAKTIRNQGHTAPGKSTSANHMTSHQPGLIPHVTGALSHD